MRRKIVFGNLFRNKKRTILSILCIGLAVMIVFLSLNVYYSFRKMTLLDAYDTYGRYNIVLHELDTDQKDKIQSMVRSKYEYGEEQIQEITDTGIAILWADVSASDMNHYKVDQGRFADSSDTVAISATAKVGEDYIIQRYHVGDKCTLADRDYSISGIIHDYDYSTTETYKVALVGAKRTDTSCLYNVYIHTEFESDYNSIKNQIIDALELSEEEIAECDKNTGFIDAKKMIINYDLNQVEFDGVVSTDSKNTGMLLIGVIIVILVSALTLVFFVFFSLFKERKKEFGIMKCIGLSDGYILSIYGWECLMIIALGSFIGVLTGILTTKGLFLILQSLRRFPLEHFDVVIDSAGFWGSVFACVLGFLLIALCFGASYRRRKVISFFQENKVGKTIRKKREKASRHLLLRFLWVDRKKYERICKVALLSLLGLSAALMLEVNRYIEWKNNARETYDAQFELLSDHNERIVSLRDQLDDVEYYDTIYVTVGEFSFDQELLNKEIEGKLPYSDKGRVFCEIGGVSREYYEKNVDASISYDEFVQSGGALIIDNYRETGQYFLDRLPNKVSYSEKKDDPNVKFSAGSVRIAGRAQFNNWEDQDMITVLLPADLFLKKFSYTNALIKINATPQKELVLAERLNAMSGMFGFTLLDHSSLYIRESDNQSTIRLGAILTFIVISVLNTVILCYLQALIYERRKRGYRIIRILGVSNRDVIKTTFISDIPGVVLSICIVVTVALIFIAKGLTDTTRMALDGGKLELVLIAGSGILFVEVISLFSQKIKMRKRTE